MSHTVEVFAPAKVNLALHVTGRHAKGYHLLDSLVAFADVGDRLRLITSGRRPRLKVVGPEAGDVPGGIDNILYNVASRFWEPTIPLSFRLDKRIPVAAGLGGGSADAAACYRGLLFLRGLAEGREARMPNQEDVKELFAVGADVPVCVLGLPARVRGFGELVDPLPGFPPLPILLTNPRIPVATPDVFHALRDKNNPGLGEFPSDFSDPDILTTWCAGQRNDLEGPAISIAPVIAEVLDALGGLPGCRLARMSGSGATCFGLFDTLAAARSAGSELAARYPDWWIAPGRLNGGEIAAPQRFEAAVSADG